MYCYDVKKPKSESKIEHIRRKRKEKLNATLRIKKLITESNIQ